MASQQEWSGHGYQGTVSKDYSTKQYLMTVVCF